MDRLTPLVVRNATAVGRIAAEMLRNRLLAAPALSALLPTGNTPLPMYAHLRALHQQGLLATARLQVCQLDEYVGLPAGDPRTYREYMRRECAGLSLAALRAPDPAAAHLDQETARYERVAHGADIAVVGIGRNGHIAFNEPGSDAATTTRVVELSESTRCDAAGDFGGLAGTPTHALTVGMATVMSAGEVLLLASGAAKAQALEQLLAGHPTAQWPASLLRDHRRLTIVCDRAAAGRP